MVQGSGCKSRFGAPRTGGSCCLKIPASRAVFTTGRPSEKLAGANTSALIIRADVRWIDWAREPDTVGEPTRFDAFPEHMAI